MKFPEWCRKYITDFWDYGPSEQFDRYYLELEALPDDPRGKRDNRVRFRADTLRELRLDLEAYREDFSRLDYDY